VRPPGGESGGGKEVGGALGAVRAGEYVLHVGGDGGTTLESGAGAAGGEAEALARALKTDTEGSAADAIGDAADDASAVTGKIERAVAIGKGAAEGKAFDPEQLVLEVDSLVGLLERLDRKGRHEEALRLARAVSTIASLIKRWLALLRALRAALRAGEALGDLKAIAWAKHELGTLRLVAGDVSEAERNLREALEIRERIGDRPGMAATTRNMRALCERLRRMLREDELVQRNGGRRMLRLSPLMLAVFALLALAVGGAAGAMLANGGGDTAEAGGTPQGHGGGDSGKGGDRPGDRKPAKDTYTLSVSIDGAGIVTSDPPGIECTSSTTTGASAPAGGDAETRLVATGESGVVPGEEEELELKGSGEGETTEPEGETPPPSERPPTDEGEPDEGAGGEIVDGEDTGACEDAFDAGSTLTLSGSSKDSPSLEFSPNCELVGEAECSIGLDRDDEVVATFTTGSTSD
jgi:hypothetical protein